MTSDARRLRADLHVHSCHSGYASHLKFLRARDCYSEPDAVYRTAKARGMDLVTLTDHDSIDGCLEFLAAHPAAEDFFISEEIECRFPDLPLRVHLGAYGIDERIHREVQRLRGSVYDAAAYLRQEHVFFAVNHLFFFFERQMPLERYIEALLSIGPAIEVQNGAMLAAHNAFIGELRDEWPRTGGAPLVATGGSDAHTLRAIGTTYTEAPGHTRDEFLASLHAGQSAVGGRHGGTGRIATEIYGVVLNYWAALLGAGRRDLSPGRRTVGAAWSLASLPFEFVPLLVAALQKRSESRRVAAYRSEWRARAARERDIARQGRGRHQTSSPAESR